MKLRPIVAGPESPTQRLSHFIDILLQPLCPLLPSYIRDDLDFLNYIPTNVPDNTILTSFDVTSLYTNIPHDLGLEAVEYWIENKRNMIDTRFETQFIIKAVKIILEENIFNFDDQVYRQIKGTAMGTKVAPSYANLVMGFLEEKLYSQVEEHFDQTFKEFLLEKWKRYLDDCFIFWTKSRADLSKFHTLLNSLHPSIQFTTEFSERELPFLDILIKISNNRITTDIFYKKTDTHQYLNFYSCHPSHIKRNIPYCMARRICAIVLDEQLRDTRLEELSTFLRRQNYPANLIKDGIERAKRLSVDQLRIPRPKEKKDLIPFVNTHNPGVTNIYNVIRTNIPILMESENMREKLTDNSIINSKRQPKNLKKILTRARFGTDPRRSYEVKTCGDKRCGICSRDNYIYLQTGSMIAFKNGQSFRVNADMNCKSENLVYCITCPTCKENYIGQTGDLSDRVRVHKQQIRHPNLRKIPLSAHLDRCASGKFKIFPFYKSPRNDPDYRKAMERHFISKFHPKLNGL